MDHLTERLVSKGKAEWWYQKKRGYFQARESTQAATSVVAYFGGGGCLIGLTCPPPIPSFSCVVGSNSSQKDLKTKPFIIPQSAFTKSEMSIGELLQGIENRYISWLLSFKAPWRLTFNIIGLYKNSTRMSTVPFVDPLMTSPIDTSS